MVIFDSMKIDFKNLVIGWNSEHPNSRITQRSLAREMVAAGVLGTIESAVNMMQYHSGGKAKSVDYEMLLFLERRFNKTFDQIVQH